MIESPVLCVIIPAYNEEELLEYSIDRLTQLLDQIMESKKISGQSYLCIIDDGSTDATWEIILKKSKENRSVNGIRLSKNFGHQNALAAGFQSCIADAYVSIDADLQDDENAIHEMIDHYHEGAQVVYGVRKSRRSDTPFKRISAKLFYRFMGFNKTGTIDNHADFRLMSSSVVRELNNFKEVNLFLRAIVPSIGFQTARVYYDRKMRFSGQSKYPIRKMLSFAWEGITSFSTFPLKMVTLAGMLIFILTMTGIFYSIIQKLTGNVIPGWTSTVLPIFFLGGVQLLCVGVLGEYIGKIYQEVKQRPRFIIQEKTGPLTPQVTMEPQ